MDKMPVLYHCYWIQGGHPVSMVKYIRNCPNTRTRTYANEWLRLVGWWYDTPIELTNQRSVQVLGHFETKIDLTTTHVILAKLKRSRVPYVKVISSHWYAKWHNIGEVILNIHSWCDNADVLGRCIFPMSECSHNTSRQHRLRRCWSDV